MEFYLSASSGCPVEDKVKELGFNRLFSFYADRNHLTEYYNYPDKIFLDSGAFSAVRKKITLNIDDYCSYINAHYKEYATIASLDIIGTGTECSEQNLDNFLYMKDKLVPEAFEKVIPAFHFGEDFKYLERLCKHSSYIALGGIAPVKNTLIRDSWLKRCFEIIPKECKVHLFGVSTLELLDKYWERIYSADSSTWYFSAINGELLSDYGRLIVSENRGFCDKSVIKYIESRGYSFEDVSTDVTARIRFNLDFLNDWLDRREKSSNLYRGFTQISFM